MSRLNWIRGVTTIYCLFIVLTIIAADQHTLPNEIIALYSYPDGDKIGHFLLLGFLAFLLACSFPRHKIRFFFLSIPITSLIVAGLASLEEYSQSFFPARTSSWLDLSFSLLGIFCFSMLAKWVIRRLNLA